LVVLRFAVWTPDPSTRPALGHRLGPANWMLSSSWASTVTLFGAILDGLLISQVLPFDVGIRLSGRDLVLLSLVFGFIVVLAPFVYSATGARPSPGAGVPPPGMPLAPEGSVGTFLIATALTMWAAFGQLATLGFAGGELSGDSAVFYVLVGVLAIVAVLMVRYSWVSIRWVLEDQAEHERRMTVTGAPGAARPAWNLL
jgi:hypothetical protein